MSDNPGYDAAIGTRQAEIKKKILETLREVPIIEFASSKCGIARSTYYRWIEGDLAFAHECEKALQHGRERINDLSESQVIKLIKEGKLPAATFWLKSNSPRYRPYRPEPKPYDPKAVLRLIQELDRDYRNGEND